MKKLLGLGLIIAGLGIGFFGIPSVLGNTSFDEAVSKLKSGDSGAVTEKVSYIAELSVLDFKYTNATSITDKNEIKAFSKKVKVPFTKKAIVMVYNGEIKIGVDADEITVEVDKGSDDKVTAVTVGLPPMKITSNDIDRDSIKYPLEKNNILNNIKTEDYAKMEKDGKAKMAKAVESNGAMDRAREELKTTITGYLTALYGDNVEITFKDI